jgi:hypothetical protein
MTVRDATPADAAAVAALLDELGYPTTEAAVAARLERFAADPASRVIVPKPRARSPAWSPPTWCRAWLS